MACLAVPGSLAMEWRTVKGKKGGGKSGEIGGKKEGDVDLAEKGQGEMLGKGAEQETEK